MGVEDVKVFNNKLTQFALKGVKELYGQCMTLRFCSDTTWIRFTYFFLNVDLRRIVSSVSGNDTLLAKKNCLFQNSIDRNPLHYIRLYPERLCCSRKNCVALYGSVKAEERVLVNRCVLRNLKKILKSIKVEWELLFWKYCSVQKKLKPLMKRWTNAKNVLGKFECRRIVVSECLLNVSTFMFGFFCFWIDTFWLEIWSKETCSSKKATLVKAN